MGEDHVGHGGKIHFDLFIMHGVVPGDLRPLVSRVREHLPAEEVADSPDVLPARPEMVVDLDEPSLVGWNARVLRLQKTGVGYPPGGHHDAFRGNFFVSAALFVPPMNGRAPSAPFDADYYGSRMNVHALL